VEIAAAVRDRDVLHHSTLRFALDGVAFEIGMQRFHEPLVDGADAVFAHLFGTLRPVLLTQFPFRLATSRRRHGGAPRQRGVDGGAILGEIPAALDRCEHVFTSAQHDHQARGAFVLVEERPQSEPFRLRPAADSAGFAGEIEDHQIDAPCVSLFDLAPNALCDHADRAPLRVKLDHQGSGRVRQVRRGYRRSHRGRIAKIEQTGDGRHRQPCGEQDNERPTNA
jgi:hypothetical protein